MEVSEDALMRIEQLVSEIAADVDRFTGNFVDKFTTGTQVARDEVRKTKEEIKRSGDEVDQMFDRIQRQQRIRLSLAGRDVDKLFETWDMRQRQTFQEFERHMVQARAGIGTLGEAIGMSGARGIYAGASKMLSTVTGAGSAGGFGGIIGLVLFGLKKEAEWAATGTRIARQFAQVGDVASESTRKAASDFVKFQYAWGASEGELAALTGSFAEFGISSSSAMRQSGLAVKGFGNTVMDAAFAMDNLYKAGAGTFGKQIGSVMASTGEDIRSATKDVVLLSSELRNLGVNVPQVSAQFIQMQSAMRMQRQGIDDLRRSFFALRGGLGEGMLKGMEPQHISSMAVSGLQAAQRAVSGLSDGLAAVIGETISGGSMTGIDAIMAMRQGFAGKGGQHFGQASLALGRMAQSSLGGTRDEQIFGLSKLLGGDLEAARAIMTMTESMSRGFASQEEETRAMNEATKELNQVFKARAAEASPWEQAMLRVTTHMAQIAAGALSFLGVIAAGIRFLVGAGGKVLGFTSDEEMREISQATNRAQNAFFSEGGIGQIASGVSGLGSVLASMSGNTELGGIKGRSVAAPFNLAAEIMRSTIREPGKPRDTSSAVDPLMTGTFLDYLSPATAPRAIGRSLANVRGQSTANPEAVAEGIVDQSTGLTPAERNKRYSDVLNETKFRMGRGETPADVASSISSRLMLDRQAVASDGDVDATLTREADGTLTFKVKDERRRRSKQVVGN